MWSADILCLNTETSEMREVCACCVVNRKHDARRGVPRDRSLTARGPQRGKSDTATPRIAMLGPLKIMHSSRLIALSRIAARTCLPHTPHRHWCAISQALVGYQLFVRRCPGLVTSRSKGCLPEVRRLCGSAASLSVFTMSPQKNNARLSPT